MPRNYPLTWLFIIATVCVDSILYFNTWRGVYPVMDDGISFFLLNFALPAQVSTLGIWAVLSQIDRLTRFAWLTSAMAMMFILVWVSIGDERWSDPVKGYMVMHISILVVGTYVLRLSGLVNQFSIVARQHNNAFHFSLIELFGWTIIVSIWAFMIRFADFGLDVPSDYDWLYWLVCSAVIPLTLVPSLERSLRPVRRITIISMALLAGALLYIFGRNFFPPPLPEWTLILSITQITYISAWWAVVRMDEVMQERRAVTDGARAKLAIFDPQDGES
jgi:hypothetical protein